MSRGNNQAEETQREVGDDAANGTVISTPLTGHSNSLASSENGSAAAPLAPSALGAEAANSPGAGAAEGSTALRDAPPSSSQFAPTIITRETADPALQVEPRSTLDEDAAKQLAERAELKSQIEEHYNSSRKWAWVWRLSHYLSLLLSFGLGLATILVLKLGNFTAESRNDVAVVLITVAAVLLILNLAMRFDDMWRRDQTKRSRLDLLRIDAVHSAVNNKALRDNLEKIVSEHNDSVLRR